MNEKTPPPKSYRSAREILRKIQGDNPPRSLLSYPCYNHHPSSLVERCLPDYSPNQTGTYLPEKEDFSI